jgi:hypothetical protein
MNEFLFTVPTAYDLAIISLILAILGCLASAVAIWYYKKRRNKYNLEVAQRHVVRQQAKVNLGLFAVYLLYVVLRMCNVTVFSFRIIEVILLFGVLLNVVIAAIRVIRFRAVEVVIAGKTPENSYGRYLPRKKRK